MERSDGKEKNLVIIFIVGEFVSPQNNVRTLSLETAREKSGKAQLRRQEV